MLSWVVWLSGLLLCFFPLPGFFHPVLTQKELSSLPVILYTMADWYTWKYHHIWGKIEVEEWFGGMWASEKELGEEEGWVTLKCKNKQKCQYMYLCFLSSVTLLGNITSTKRIAVIIILEFWDTKECPSKDSAIYSKMYKEFAVVGGKECACDGYSRWSTCLYLERTKTQVTNYSCEVFFYFS